MVPKVVETMVGNDSRGTEAIEFRELNRRMTNLMNRVLGTTPCLILIDEFLSQVATCGMPMFGEPI